MAEFNEGIFQILCKTSIGRALIYTVGHVIIAMSVVSIITGASIFQAGLVAFIEPSINGIWYYILDKTWSKMYK